jgi:NAD(P)-dependent dehydrogenase (short-subunit alcohol dehydrogenase family)
LVGKGSRNLSVVANVRNQDYNGGRLRGAREEVARAMLYLLQSDFVTGEVIFVTGGEHLRGATL